MGLPSNLSFLIIQRILIILIILSLLHRFDDEAIAVALLLQFVLR